MTFHDPQRFSHAFEMVCFVQQRACSNPIYHPHLFMLPTCLIALHFFTDVTSLSKDSFLLTFYHQEPGGHDTLYLAQKQQNTSVELHMLGLNLCNPFLLPLKPVQVIISCQTILNVRLLLGSPILLSYSME